VITRMGRKKKHLGKSLGGIVAMGISLSLLVDVRIYIFPFFSLHVSRA
jgi:hypothetical protein